MMERMIELKGTKGRILIDVDKITSLVRTGVGHSKITHDICVHGCGYSDLNEPYDRVKRKMDNAYKKMYSIEMTEKESTKVEQQGWIPCSERMPEEGQGVIFVYKHNTWNGWFDGKNKMFHYLEFAIPIENVSHWMPYSISLPPEV